MHKGLHNFLQLPRVCDCVCLLSLSQPTEKTCQSPHQPVYKQFYNTHSTLSDCQLTTSYGICLKGRLTKTYQPFHFGSDPDHVRDPGTFIGNITTAG